MSIPRKPDPVEGEASMPEFVTLWDRADDRLGIKRAEYGDERHPGQWIASDLYIEDHQ